MSPSKGLKYAPNSFITVPNKHVLRGMSPQAQVLFMWLCNYKGANDECWPSISTLTKDCGMSKNSVIRALKELYAEEVVSKISKAMGKGSWASNLYHIHEVAVSKTKNRMVPDREAVVPHRDEGSASEGVGVVPEGLTNSIHNNSTHISSVASDASDTFFPGVKPFSYQTAIVELAEKSYTHRIAAIILKEQGIAFANEKQLKNALGRALKAATSLTGYTTVQVHAAIDVCREEGARLGYPWTPQTICKKIAQVANEVSEEQYPPDILRARALARQMGMELD